MYTLKESAKLRLFIYRVNLVFGEPPVVTYRVMNQETSDVVMEFDVEVPDFNERNNYSVTYEEIIRKSDRMILDQLDRLRRDIIQT